MIDTKVPAGKIEQSLLEAEGAYRVAVFGQWMTAIDVFESEESLPLVLYSNGKSVRFMMPEDEATGDEFMRKVTFAMPEFDWVLCCFLRKVGDEIRPVIFCEEGDHRFVSFCCSRDEVEEADAITKVADTLVREFAEKYPFTQPTTLH